MDGQDISTPKVLTDLQEWQDAVKKPRTRFKRDDALVFWQLIREGLEKRIWRDGIADFSQVIIEVGNGLGLRIQTPNPRTKILVDVMNFDFDAHDNWEHEAIEIEKAAEIAASEERKLAKQERKTKKTEPKGETDFSPEDNWVENFADPTAEKGESAQKKKFSQQIEKEDTAGVQDDFVQKSPLVEPKKRPQVEIALVSALRSKSAIANLPDHAVKSLSNWLLNDSGLNPEFVVDMVQAMSVEVKEEATFYVEDTPCVMATTYSAVDGSEKVVIVAHENCGSHASQKITVGRIMVGESILYTKTNEHLPSSLVFGCLEKNGLAVSIVEF